MSNMAEKQLILSFFQCIVEKKYHNAHKYLQTIVEKKVKKRIAKTKKNKLF